MRFPSLSLGKKEDAILNGIEGHLSQVRQTVDALRKLASSAGSADDSGVMTNFQAVLDGESKADDLHRNLSMQIAQGAFFGGVREDMLNLLEKIESIAHTAKDASRLIGQEEQLDDFSRSILSSENMSQFLSNQVAAVSALADLIAAFKLGKNEVLARIHNVEEFEEKADLNKADLLKQTFAIEGRTNPVSVIQMRDFVSTTDNIADNAEDASDVVLVLIAKGYD